MEEFSVFEITFENCQNAKFFLFMQNWFHNLSNTKLQPNTGENGHLII